MRFTLLMIPGGYERAAPGAMPDPAHVSEMMKYNGAMQDAGVLLALDGLHPPSVGARISFGTGKPEVLQAPFPGVSEVLGGYWMIRVNSRQEAIDRAMRYPATGTETIEVRQGQEWRTSPPRVRDAAAG